MPGLGGSEPPELRPGPADILARGFGARAAFGVRGIKFITDGIPASTPDGQGQAATFNLDTAERASRSCGALLDCSWRRLGRRDPAFLA